MYFLLEFHEHIWNHHELLYIQLSTNMPDIGLEMCVKFWEFWETKRFGMDVETNGSSVQSLKINYYN